MISLDLDKALELIEDRINPIKDLEEVKLNDGLGRIIGEDFLAPMDNPPFDRSPLDGFAFRSSDSKGASRENPKKLRVIDRAYAGEVSRELVGEGQAVRIMTGGKMPEGADCVIKIESVREAEDHIYIYNELNRHDNYVFRGEDIKKGELLIEKGRKLKAIDLGVLSSMGQDRIRVYREPRVGIIATGDEIVRPGESLDEGQIYGSNHILIGSRLRELGIEPVFIEQEKDDVDLVSEKILEKIGELDLLLTTGGVSVGDKDIFHDVIKKIGAERVFWKLKLKPGSPLLYSQLEGKPIISLSGNPFAALVTFELVVRQALYLLIGDEDFLTKKGQGKMLKNFDKKSKTTRYVRAIYRDGRVSLPEGGHSSGMLASMADCNVLIEIEKGNLGLKKGDLVDIRIL